MELEDMKLLANYLYTTRRDSLAIRIGYVYLHVDVWVEVGKDNFGEGKSSLFYECPIDIPPIDFLQNKKSYPIAQPRNHSLTMGDVISAISILPINRMHIQVTDKFKLVNKLYFPNVANLWIDVFAYNQHVEDSLSKYISCSWHDCPWNNWSGSGSDDLNLSIRNYSKTTENHSRFLQIPNAAISLNSYESILEEDKNITAGDVDRYMNDMSVEINVYKVKSRPECFADVVNAIFNNMRYTQLLIHPRLNIVHQYYWQYIDRIVIDKLKDGSLELGQMFCLRNVFLTNYGGKV